MAKIKKVTTVAKKPAKKTLPDLNAFIENINKKDKLNGKKITFGFSKRKRK